MKTAINRHLTILLSSVALTMGSLPALALAQAVTPTTDNHPPAAERASEESRDIIVTANKRAQVLTDVGLSVAVVGAQALETRQIATAEDLANVIPGLSVGNSGFMRPVRGWA